MATIAVTTYVRTEDRVEMVHDPLRDKWFLRCRVDQDAWYWHPHRHAWVLMLGLKILMDYNTAWGFLQTIPPPATMPVSMFPKFCYEKVPLVP